MVVRLKDIAEETGFSVKTVSMALNGGGTVREDTRTSICMKAREMGYTMAFRRAVSSSKRSLTVGLLCRMADEEDQRLFEAISFRLNDAGYDPYLMILREGRSERDLMERLIDRKVDGIVMRLQLYGDSDFPVEELAEKHIPVVAVESIDPMMDCADFVATDDAMGAQLAARHLIQLGHRSITILDSADAYSPMSVRSIAFAEAVRSSDVSVDLHHLQVSYADRNVLDPRLLLAGHPTAFFCAADYLAPGLLETLKSEGLQAPWDASVLSFGGLREYRHLKPKLTSVYQDFEAVGTLAADRLIQRIQGRAGVLKESLLVPPRLIPGDSCVPPKRETLSH
jgi:LacI family transcriptional regulator